MFKRYINRRAAPSSTHVPHMYADDPILSTASISTTELQAKINKDLTNIKNWLLANKLSLNVAKTEYMFFGKDFRLSNLG